MQMEHFLSVYILCTFCGYMFPMLHRVFSVQLLLYVMIQGVHRVYTGCHSIVYSSMYTYVLCKLCTSFRVAGVAIYALQGDYSMRMYMHVYVSCMLGVICNVCHTYVYARGMLYTFGVKVHMWLEWIWHEVAFYGICVNTKDIGMLS